MSRTYLPTDDFIAAFDRLLESAQNPQAGLDSALKDILACSGASAGLVALQLAGESQPRLLSTIGFSPDSLQSRILSRGIILTMQGTPPEFLFHRKVAAALPLLSASGYQGVLLLFGRQPLKNIDCLYAATSALGGWSERQRRGAVPPDLTLLLRSRNTLRALFDNLPLSLYIIDSNYNLVALNKSRANRARVRPSGVVGSKCYRALYGRVDACPGCLVAESLQFGMPTNRLSSQGGRHKFASDWEISTFPILGPAGEALQAILMEIDVTEKKTLEASLVQSEKLAAIGQVAAGVAHEINNPLAAIIANTQILARDLPMDSNLQESLELIQIAGNRASEVISRLLNYSRREEYQLKPVDVNENIRKSVVLIQQQLDLHGASLQLNLAGKLPRIYASASHLQGVWTNLILNALDAGSQRPLKIEITTCQYKEGLQVLLSDNGAGIPPADLPHIFEPFFTTKDAGRGTGLGLSICQRVVRHHGGQIEVESVPDDGTRFIISLPKKPPGLHQ